MALLLAGCMFWTHLVLPRRPVNWKSGMVYCYVGRLCWCDSRRGLSSAEGSWQGIFCPLLADIVLIVGLIFSSFKSEFSLKNYGPLQAHKFYAPLTCPHSQTSIARV